MCGRYYVDDNTAREIEKLVHQIDNELNHSGDINPSQRAPVITGRTQKLQLEKMYWGFPQYKGNGLLINARAETVLERKMFRDSVLNRRCFIPACGFYEWDKDKNRVLFTSKTEPVLYMAGFFNMFQEKERFIVITTAANSSVSSVHDRMPLILEQNELQNWIYDEHFLNTALKKIPPLLQRHQKFEQQCLPL